MCILVNNTLYKLKIPFRIEKGNCLDKACQLTVLDVVVAVVVVGCAETHAPNSIVPYY